MKFPDKFVQLNEYGLTPPLTSIVIEPSLVDVQNGEEILKVSTLNSIGCKTCIIVLSLQPRLSSIIPL